MKTMPCARNRVQGILFGKVRINKYLYLRSSLICAIVYNRNMWGEEVKHGIDGLPDQPPEFCILAKIIAEILLDFLNFCLTNWLFGANII